MLVTLAGTVSVSAMLWLPMPKLAMKLGPALNGELQSYAVSLATNTHQTKGFMELGLELG